MYKPSVNLESITPPITSGVICKIRPVLLFGKLAKPANSADVSIVTVALGSVIVNVVVTASVVASLGAPHPSVLFKAS